MTPYQTAIDAIETVLLEARIAGKPWAPIGAVEHAARIIRRWQEEEKG